MTKSELIKHLSLLGIKIVEGRYISKKEIKRISSRKKIVKAKLKEIPTYIKMIEKLSKDLETEDKKVFDSCKEHLFKVKDELIDSLFTAYNGKCELCEKNTEVQDLPTIEQLGRPMKWGKEEIPEDSGLYGKTCCENCQKVKMGEEPESTTPDTSSGKVIDASELEPVYSSKPCWLCDNKHTNKYILKKGQKYDFDGGDLPPDLTEYRDIILCSESAGQDYTGISVYDHPKSCLEALYCRYKMRKAKEQRKKEDENIAKNPYGY